MDPVIIGTIGIVILLLLFFTGMPVGFVMILIGFLGFGSLVSLGSALSLLAKDLFHVYSEYNLTVIPL
ncbi:MAG: C4-dicarboxylate ABC transporter permease, partial [Desulfosalsimonas sp.]